MDCPAPLVIVALAALELPKNWVRAPGTEVPAWPSLTIVAPPAVAVS